MPPPTDYFGPLAIPVPVGGAGQASGDPILDYFLAFFKAVLNAYAGDAWAAMKSPGKLPVIWTFAGLDPRKRPFIDTKLPALFLFRDDETKAADHFTQDWWTVTSTLSLIWLYPGASAEHQILRDPFSNAVTKICRTALLLGRDPAWVVPGDSYPVSVADCQANGSVLAHWTKTVMPVTSSKVAHLDVKVVDEDGKPSVAGNYVATQMVFEIVEKYTRDLSRYQPMDNGVDIVVTTSPSDPGGPLTTGHFTIYFQAQSITPAAGTIAGGDAVTILGTDFLAGASVTIGGVACTQAVVVDAHTITAVTPAHAAGAVDVVVTNLSGETGTLAAAFTFA